MTVDDDITFLSFVGGDFNFFRFVARGVFCLNEKGFGNAVLERSRQIVIDHFVGFFNALAFPLTGDSVTPEFGAETFDKVGHIDFKGQSAAVDKGKVQIGFTAFTFHVFAFADPGFFRHFLGGKTGDFSQIPDTGGHFLNFKIKSCCHKYRVTPLFWEDEKNPSQRY